MQYSKTLMKDKGLSVTQLVDGRYTVRIEYTGHALERTFSDYDAMQAWIDGLGENQ